MIDYSTLEIVGFDEEVKTRCGRSRALYRDPSSDLYFFIPQRCEDLNLIPTMRFPEIQEASARFELTVFTSGQFNAALSPDTVRKFPAFEGAVVIFVGVDFLKEVELDRPSPISRDSKLPGHHPSDWLLLNGRLFEFWVNCTLERMSETILNLWAEKMREKTLRHLLRFLETTSQVSLKDAQRTVNWGLHAALKSSSHLDSLYLLKGITHLYSGQPELVDSLFSVVNNKIPHWSWLTFRTQLDHLNDSLKVMAKTPDPDDLEPRSWSSILGRLYPSKRKQQKAPAKMSHEELHELVERIRTGPSQRVISSCAEAAAKLRAPVSDERRAELLTKLQENATHDGVDLNDEEILILQGEPLIYYPGVITFGKKGISLNLVKLADACVSFESEGRGVDSFMRQAIEAIGTGPLRT